MARTSSIWLPLLLLLASGSRILADEPTKTDGSDLGVTIMGSIVQKNSDDNVALIKDQTGSVKAVKRDHVILDKFKVLAVHDKYIEVVSRDAKRYWIFQDKFAGTFVNTKNASGPALSGISEQYKEDGFERNKDKISMTAMYRDKLVKEDLAKVLMQATAEPHMENGAIVGFKVSQIDADSIYAKAGLIDNDVITGVNGQELNSIAGSIKLLQSLKGSDHLEVELRRNGQTMKFSVDVN